MTRTKSSLLQESPNGVALSAANTSALTVELMTITPDLAAAWLARGGKNRHVNQRRVDIMVAAIHRGEWHLTGEAVKLDADGRVRDGQHRLHAIVKSQTPVPMLVVRGVTEAAFDVMDSGRPRTTGDVLGIHGTPSANAVAGAVRFLMFMERFGRPNPGQREAAWIVTSPTTLRYVEEHPDVLNGVRLADRVRAAGVQGGISLWGGLLTLFLRVDAEAAYQYAHHLSSGADLSTGHPLLLLRNRLLFRKTGEHQKVDPSREQVAGLAIKAWNAWRGGKTINALYWRSDGDKPEPFPAVLS